MRRTDVQKKEKLSEKNEWLPVRESNSPTKLTKGGQGSRHNNARLKLILPGGILGEGGREPKETIGVSKAEGQGKAYQGPGVKRAYGLKYKDPKSQY